MTNQITKSVTVAADAGTAYQAWHEFENFPYFMNYIERVEKTGPTMSHWEVKGPLGTKVDWNAEMTRDVPNKQIGWNTKDHDGAVTTSGQVTFNQLPDNQTQITVQMNYDPPAGKAGEIVANLFANPEQRLIEDLNNFKRYLENGI